MDILAIDEALISYQPSKIVKDKAELAGEPIPLAYIPRKPHPNGLLFYLGVTFIDHPVQENSILPFVVDLLPHLKVGDISPIKAVEKIMQR